MPTPRQCKEIMGLLFKAEEEELTPANSEVERLRVNIGKQKRKSNHIFGSREWSEEELKLGADMYNELKANGAIGKALWGPIAEKIHRTIPSVAIRIPRFIKGDTGKTKPYSSKNIYTPEVQEQIKNRMVELGSGLFDYEKYKIIAQEMGKSTVAIRKVVLKFNLNS